MKYGLCMKYTFFMKYGFCIQYGLCMKYRWNMNIFKHKNEGRYDFSIEIGNIKEKEILWVSDTWDCYKWIELMMHILF